MAGDSISVDALIFGGGAAGLWLLDELVRNGHSALLLEANALGQGQTVLSQGIIHGGFKYTLTGAFSDSADAIKQLPQRWRACLAGDAKPDLSQTKLRSDFCYLWSTGRLLSKLGMMAASWVLQVKPNSIPRQQWPAILTGTRGSVSRLDEQVLVPQSFIAALAKQHQGRLLHVGAPRRYEIECNDSHTVKRVTLHDPQRDATLFIQPRNVILTAGKGNAALRQACGLSADAMQVRPLHVIMARGPLPDFNGHCIDGNKTRVTITTDTDSQGRRIWQLGGQVSEDGVKMSRPELIEHTKRELKNVLPGASFEGVEWSTYRADRAEGATRGGGRPSDAVIHHDGNVITCWPTKLVLAPITADRIRAMLPHPEAKMERTPDLGAWPAPQVAQPPWESWLDDGTGS